MHTIGFSHILRQDSDLTPEQLRSLDLVHQSGQHLLTLINDVLQLSKLNADKLKLNYCDFNLIHLLHDIMAMFQIRAEEKSLNFVSHIALDLPEVINTDETRLRQVLLNLLSNAFKFTTQGTITFSVTAVTIAADSETKQIRFQVEDTGIGIAPQDHETIFAAFGQLEPNNDGSEGTGLGLSICQNILRLMDSELHLASQVGSGSRFWFDLMLATIPASFCVTPETQTTHLKRKLTTPCKVLLVDDNDDNRLLLLKYLEPWGFLVEQAANGRAGLAIAKSFQPDVILVDLMMPIMGGQEMIELLRKDVQLQNTITILVSANVHSVIDSSDIKCDGFLAKPIDLKRLSNLLDTHLELNWQIITPNMAPKPQLITPAATELLHLLEFVNYGDMESLLAAINLLEQDNPQYFAFVQKIRQMADSCQQQNLEQLLETYIQQQEHQS